uniref:ShKT domain-containing protein n=1 Tax=Strongyloides stercoralis TaxID=6248 RepID=A0A0K0ECF7_STRER
MAYNVKLLFFLLFSFLTLQGSSFFFFQRPEIIEIKNGIGRPNLIRLKKNVDIKEFCNQDSVLDCLMFSEVSNIKQCLNLICKTCYQTSDYKNIAKVCKFI